MTPQRQSSPAARSGDPRIAQLIVEALDSFLSPATRDRVLAEALAAFGLDALPSEARQARRFVQEALSIALEAWVGADIRDAVIESLEPVLAIAAEDIAAEDSAEREIAAPATMHAGPRSRPPREGESRPRRSPHPAQLPPAPAEERAEEDGSAESTSPGVTRAPCGIRAEEEGSAEPSATPSKPVPAVFPGDSSGIITRASTSDPTEPASEGRMDTTGPRTIPVAPRSTRILFATKDLSAYAELVQWLGHWASVEQARHVVDLVAVTELPGPPPIVILDGESPSIELGSVLALHEDWPSGTEILLFRPRPDDLSTVAAAALNAESGDSLEWLVATLMQRLSPRSC
jgi:hypothetical protein